jgi:hypothetical protein
MFSSSTVGLGMVSKLFNGCGKFLQRSSFTMGSYF